MSNRRIGSLWLRQSKEGKKYYSGVLQDLRGDINIVIFPNDRKEKESQPDFAILLSEPKEQKASGPVNDMFIGAPTPSSRIKDEEIPVINEDDDQINVDDIPF